MPKSISEILGSDDVLAEDIKIQLAEAYEKKISEQREEVATELREEFAARYENDKEQIIEAMDVMLKQALKKEISEFAQDREKIVEDRAKLAERQVQYRKAVKQHSNLLNKVVAETLKKEIKELHEDRKSQKTKIKKLEKFVIEQLTAELNEFHEDKRSLDEQKVRMVKEGKKAIGEAKRNFVKKGSVVLERLVEKALYKNLAAMRDDIQKAKENEFGRQIFEAFASEYMTSTLNESTHVSKLAKEIIGLRRTIAESKDAVAEKDRALNEAKRRVRMAEEASKRKQIMSEMLSPLTKDQKEIMETLLESAKTSQLKAAYNKYLPNVLKEDTSEKGQARKAQLKENNLNGKRQLTERVQNENHKEVNGNRATRPQPHRPQQDVSGSADIIELKKLAGLS